MQIIMISVHAFAAPKSHNSSVLNIILAIISIVVAQSSVRGRVRLIWSLPPL
jgi:hypothetical protein